jgi:alkanesulfonate monooxygenase SsuD/methylene tetrahydromethanopterin reductase-like flavin-dependent oxidoreductase (luciferase family)
VNGGYHVNKISVRAESVEARSKEISVQFGLFTLFDFFRDQQDEVAYYRDSLDIMIEAERLGFDSVWVGEEHFYSFGICPSPQIFLTALARETSRIRLGTAISLLPFDNPLRKAEDFAMLDLLSGGRLNFGVGRGIIPKHFEGFRVDPRESRARYEESLTIIRKAWTEDPFSYAGEFWQVPSLSLSPKPLQKPHPPIYRGTLSLESFEGAARAGDNAFVVPWLSAPHPEVSRRVERYRTLLTEHGHSEKHTTFIFFLFIDPDHQVAMRDGRDSTRAYTQLITSFVPQMALQQLREEDPLKMFLDLIMSLPDHLEERTVTGTPAECRRRLAELHDEFGLDQVAFYFHAGGRDPQRARRSLELFAQEVMPEFREK